MSINHRTYRKNMEYGFNEYRKQLENWRMQTEATEHGAGETVSLDRYGRTGQLFSSKVGFTELRLTGRGSTYMVITGPQNGGWFIYVPAMGILCAIRNPEDYLSNKFHLGKVMGSLDALSIAEGVCAYVKDTRSQTLQPGRVNA